MRYLTHLSLLCLFCFPLWALSQEEVFPEITEKPKEVEEFILETVPEDFEFSLEQEIFDTEPTFLVDQEGKIIDIMRNFSHKREIFLYVYDHENHWHHHSDDAPERNLITLQLDELGEFSQEMEEGQQWYGFSLPLHKKNNLTLEFRGEDIHLEIPEGRSPVYISIISERLFPEGVTVWTQEDIQKNISPRKTEVSGTIPIHHLEQKDIPSTVYLHLPFANWDGQKQTFSAPLKGDIDWMNARFKFSVSPVFTSIAFIQYGTQYYPLFLPQGEHFELEWKPNEENPALLDMMDKHRRHRHGIQAQDFLNMRYPQGMSSDAYKNLVRSMTGSREMRMDTLIAWSRAIVPFYEENNANPERFLTHVNQIGNLSWKDAFEEAFETHNRRMRRDGYDDWKEFSAFFLVGALISFLLFVVGMFFKKPNSRYFSPKNVEKLELIFHGFFWMFVGCEMLIWGQHYFIEIAGPALWILYFGIIGLFYVNWKYMVPRFLLKKRWGRYLGAVVGLSALFGVLLFIQVINPLSSYTLNYLQGDWMWVEYPMEQHPGMDFELMGALYMVLLVVAPIYASVRHVLLNGVPKLRAQKEALNAELKTLKTQISPHFFFNSLNTVYSFALTEESPKTAEAITKLSDLMRFAIYQGDQKLIPLETELEYLSDYVEMQRLRLNPVKHDLQYRVDGDPGNLKIAPLLLITLIENAFKHGISMSKDSYIQIDLFILDKGLILTVENSVHPKELVHAGNAVVKEGGVGLVNTRERLNLLYAGKHEWRIEEEADRYFTQLSLDLAD